MDRIEVLTNTLPVAQWLRRYRAQDRFREACGACPNYGGAWSCPPGVPEAESYLGNYRRVCLVGLKVIYDPAARAAATSPEAAESLRGASYGAAKRTLNRVMLALEGAFPGSRAVAAGGCEECPVCARVKGGPCRRPDRMRYSFSAFGFDLTKMAGEMLGLDLLWAREGLPEYDVALAALLTGEGEPGVELELKYVWDGSATWAQTQRELTALAAGLGFRLAPGGEEPQTDVYYDTPRGDLDRLGVSLRIRRKGEARLLTCKRPSAPGSTTAGAFSRREAESPAADGDFTAPENRAFLRRQLPDHPGLWDLLVPAVTVRTLRRTWELTGPAGARSELALDQTWYENPATGRCAEEKQVELERLTGGGGDLAALAEAIRGAGLGLIPAEGSKYRRARRLTAGEGA